MSDFRKAIKADSPFLFWYDLEGNTPVEVEIEGWDHKEAFCPGKGEKGILWCLQFKGKKKVLGVNITNGHLIAHHHGTDKDQWGGKKITLRIADCKGEKCIRIDAPGARLPPQCPKFKYLDSRAAQ